MPAPGSWQQLCACYAGYEGRLHFCDDRRFHEEFEGNIAVSKKVADAAAAPWHPCEAELGKVGGKEDDLEAEADTNTAAAGKKNL